MKKIYNKVDVVYPEYLISQGKTKAEIKAETVRQFKIDCADIISHEIEIYDDNNSLEVDCFLISRGEMRMIMDALKITRFKTNNPHLIMIYESLKNKIK